MRWFSTILLAIVTSCSPSPDSETQLITRHQALDAGADASEMGANSPPVAVDDEVEVEEDGSVTFDVLENDSDPDGDELTVFVVETAREGTLTPLGAGVFEYVPRVNFNGTDEFTYRVLDGRGGEDTAVVHIVVTPVNDPPMFVPPTPPHMTTLTVVAGDTLEFQMAATDVDGDELTFGHDPFETLADPPTVEDGRFRWTPDRFDLGVTFVRIFVSDGMARDERDLTIDIVEPADQICGEYRCNGSDVCFERACYAGCDESSACGADTACWDGRCARSPCEGRSCEEGSTCFGGTCFVECADDGDCSAGERCWDGRCAESSCAGITCEVGSICVGGSCRVACDTDADCDDGSCFARGCASAACDGIVCPDGQRCIGGECLADDAAGDACVGDTGACDEIEPQFEAAGCGCEAGSGPASWFLVIVTMLLVASTKRRAARR